MLNLVAALALHLTTPASAQTAHGLEAADWVRLVDPANNDYGDPASITWSGAEPIVLAKCGSFLGLVFEETYDDVDDDLLIALTGEASPHAASWFDAIDAGATADGYALIEVDGDALTEGDLLVAAYGPGAVDHAMLVASVRDVTGLTDSINKPYKAGPAGTTATLLVGVYDASQSPHGPDATNLRARTDTRFLFPDAGSTIDKGIGYGEILVYTDAGGDLVGWRWSVVSSTLHVVSGTPGTGETLRPLIAGRMTGPEL